ncbi:MAG TPA: carboxypeptidase-like regulatory domain-containing protein [Candidatus Binataceae bacterium]|nr:carboxypeptidase-like regulatory domain-containing protein [Candidatus Binataceae bacterium]
MKKPSAISTTCITIIAAAFAVMATVHPVAASVRSVEIRGVVQDLQGRPIEALKISLSNWFGGVSASAVTDEHGQYRIENVAPGKYYVRIRPLGISTRGQLIVITVPPHRMGLNLTLSQNIPALVRADSPFAAA